MSRTLALLHVAALTLLTAAISPISQLTLAPIFSVSLASVNHAGMISLTFVLGFGVVPWFFPEGSSRVALILGVWPFYVPVVQAFLCGYNGELGPVGGAILNGFLSCHTLLFLSANAVAHAMRQLDRESVTRNLSVRAALTFVALIIYRLLEAALARSALALLFALDLHPLHLQLFLAASYTLLLSLRRRFLWHILLIIPAILHALFLNPHLTVAAANRALAPLNWTLLDRHWSTTGYISVLHNHNDDYLVLRCDHSLLGGEFLATPQRRRDEGWHVNEPVYAVFAMLEAVRLIVPDNNDEHSSTLPPDTDAHALVVGLGIGTAPAALIAHGITTTILELDPVVHAFATRHFHLPPNHTAHLTDAAAWVSTHATPPSPLLATYHYILHDVFTGGTEPLPLFMSSFLTPLRALLAPGGVIAINYAGTLASPLTARVIHTATAVFEHQCRIFSDLQQPSPSEAAAAAEEDSEAANIIIFCINTPLSSSSSSPSHSTSTHTAHQKPFTFRPPSPRDFLHSWSRAHHLLPRPDQELFLRDFAPVRPHPSGDAGDFPEVVRDLQLQNARVHWDVMRRVVPDGVWEIW